MILLRLLSTLFIVSIQAVVWGQVQSKVVAPTALPSGLLYKGKPLQALQFQDQTGNYVALTTETTTLEDQAHLAAYVYTSNGSMLWQLRDGISDCPLDRVAVFVPGSFKVTDLDKNGKAEVWVAYRIGCRGDVSPSELKIIMHEGTTKYAMRGMGKLKVGHAVQPDGGTITSNGFRKSTFERYAEQLWKAYLVEVME
ncbi:M949_RS01915 family surface polysaccharide biosynthesis protein [Siphonobacter sp.]|uniref:M949_RS01915 family surface polysaccharide biosynthesis protein n=1 Tax=Siphonobacter sp. TaxID=1869184 RepID=UPI003B3B4F80